MTAALHDLARRAEEATAEQQRELLEAGWHLLKPAPSPIRQPGFEHIGYGIGPYSPEYRTWRIRRATFLALLDIGTDEAFLAAAMMLVPEGWRWMIVTDDIAAVYQRKPGQGGYAVIYDSDCRNRPPALALLAAECRAHASKEAGNGR